MSKVSKGSSNSYTPLFYTLVGAGIAGVLGSVYYLYSLLSDDELNEKEIIEIEEIKQNIEEKGELTQDSAVHILFLANKHAEEYAKQLKPDLESRRRAAFNNDYEYKALISEFLQLKEQAYMNSSQTVLNQFNVSMEDLQKKVETLHPMEMERKFFQFEAPAFEKERPDKQKTKEAFVFYGNKFMEEVQKLSMGFHSMGNDPQAQEMMMFNMLVVKFRVEDLLYFKFFVTEQQIRYLLYHYNLTEDPDVMQIHKKIASFDEMLG